MHDCNPPSEECAYPPDKRITSVWCGDVWKAIAYLRSCRNDLSIFTVDADYGLGIVVKDKSDKLLPYSKAVIEKMSYLDFDKNRAEILNLKNLEHLNNFFNDFQNE